MVRVSDFKSSKHLWGGFDPGRFFGNWCGKRRLGLVLTRKDSEENTARKRRITNKQTNKQTNTQTKQKGTSL